MHALILFAHPAFDKSVVNKKLIDGVKNLDGITFHDLYEKYPEFDIDIDYEQKLLEDHDCIIFHHPFFWYSTPAILKEWQDLVLTHGWAYGSKGKALEGKLFFSVITTGAPHISYHQKGYNHHTINQLLAPLTQTANLCRMLRLPPFVVFGSHAIEENDLKIYKNDYLRLLELITKGDLDIPKSMEYEYMNEYINKEE